MRTQSVDTSPEAERVLIELIRKAPIAKRFELVRSLTAFAIKLNKQNIREQYSKATEQQVAERFVLDHYNSVLANGLHSALQKMPVHLSDTPNIINAITPISTLFRRMNIAYCLTGTIASSIYGMQRAAFDIDFIAGIGPKAIAFLLENLSSTYYFDKATIKEANICKTSFEGLHIESVLRVNIHSFHTGTFAEEMYRRVQTHILTKDDKAFCIASPEDIVLTQLLEYEAGGEVADDRWNELLGVLKVQKETIDSSYLEQWAVTLGIGNLLRRAFEDAGIGWV